MEVTSHASVAMLSTTPTVVFGSPCHTTTAKIPRPTLPMAAPAASTPAAALPRAVLSWPASSFFRCSCFSISVAVAGKIAGNARKSPPISGPKCFAMIPVNAVTAPPNTKRPIYSYHRDSRSPSVVIFIFTSYPNSACHRPKAQTNHNIIDQLVTDKTAGRFRISNRLTTDAYTKKATAPRIIDRASTLANS